MNAFKLPTCVYHFARILALAVLIFTATAAFAVLIDWRESGEEGIPVASPLNEEFLNLQREPSLIQLMKYSDDGHPLGLLPSPHDFSHLTNPKNYTVPHPPNLFDILRGRARANQEWIEEPSSIWIESVPSTYDLRTQGKLTAIRNQGSCGSCWAFATYGSLESFLMPAEAWDFSEQNLIDESGFDPGPCDGGFIDMSSAYLARWSGPLREIDDPYIYASATNSTAKKHVQEVVYLAPRSGPLANNLIKQSVVANGAVYASMYYKGAYYNGAYKSYYNPGVKEGGHGVAIVGWNDNFERNKFNYLPPGKGAFIARNSWGEDWGEHGYFYVSYYDEYFAREGVSASLKAQVPTNYEINYQYDPLGWTNSLGYVGSETAWMANIFTSSSNIPLKAVSFYTAANQNSYEIYIYTDVSSGQPRSGTLRRVKKGQINSPGYHTIALDSTVPLGINQKFSVVTKLRTVDFDYPIPMEMPLYFYSSGARAHAGESFVSSNGSSWNDLHTSWGGQFWNTNVCLKALAGLPPLYPPLNARIERLENDLIFFREYINRLSWESNPANTTGIQKYKIYRKPRGSNDNDYEALAEVPSGVFSYDDRGLSKDDFYSYWITTIDEYNRESEPGEVSN
jgi:C1A family cysteine protease